MKILQRLAASISGKYTVERELGTGGMAYVYLSAVGCQLSPE